MIYIHAGINDFQKSVPLIIEKLEKTCAQLNCMKSEVCFLLDRNADEILLKFQGLENFSYYFSPSLGLYNHLLDLRYDLMPDSILVENLDFSLQQIFELQNFALQAKDEADFYRLCDGDRVLGVYYYSHYAQNKVLKLASDSLLSATHFTWKSFYTLSSSNASKHYDLS